MVEFLNISPDELLLKSFELGRKIYERNFIPTHAISLWRGGTPVGLGVNEFFRLKGYFINHTTVATASYTEINRQRDIIIKGLEHLIKVIAKEDNLLIIDDIYDSGNTINAIIETIHRSAKANTPDNILIACIHKKKKKREIGLPLIYLEEISDNKWVSYPHEISDMVLEENPDESLLRNKLNDCYPILSENKYPQENIEISDVQIYLSANQVFSDGLKLACNIYNSHYVPDFIIAIWPGGIYAGLPIHEYYKYMIKKGKLQAKYPDHISINTSTSHLSYKTNVVGVRYIEENVNNNNEILIIETVFSTGRLINQTIIKLKEILKRNLNIEKIKIATIYYNPRNDVTMTTPLYFKEPHFYLKRVNKTVVFPHNIHGLRNKAVDLDKVNPGLKKILEY